MQPSDALVAMNNFGLDEMVRQHADRISQRTVCRLCDNTIAAVTLDLGELPPCNRYSMAAPTRDRRRLQVTECPACGLIQLADDTPVDFVRPRVPWIRYNEPGGHLGVLADWLAARMRGAGVSAFGVGPFDQPLLDALARCAIRTLLLDAPSPYSGAAGEYPYLETLQERLRPEPLGVAAEQYGTADIVLCRYLLEHSHAPVASLQGLRKLVSRDGCLVVEVPDSSKFLQRHDYSFIWEEHICYFSEGTLRALAARAEFTVDALFRYEGPLEDALVAVLRPRTAPVAQPAAAAAEQGRASPVFQAYCGAFAGIRTAWQARLNAWTAGGRKVALIGIGHQAVMFVNAMGLQRHVSLMADDDLASPVRRTNQSIPAGGPVPANFLTTYNSFTTGIDDPANFNPANLNAVYYLPTPNGRTFQNWFFSVQRNLGLNTLVEVAYNGDQSPQPADHRRLQPGYAERSRRASGRAKARTNPDLRPHHVGGHSGRQRL